MSDRKRRDGVEARAIRMMMHSNQVISGAPQTVAEDAAEIEALLKVAVAEDAHHRARLEALESFVLNIAMADQPSYSHIREARVLMGLDISGW